MAHAPSAGIGRREDGDVTPPDAERERRGDPVRVVVARTAGELTPHERGWRALLAAASPDRALPMAGPAWLQAWLAHRVPASETFRGLFAYQGDRLVGVMPVVTRRHALLGAWRPWLLVPTDDHAHAGEPLTDGSDEVLRALVGAALGEGAVGLWFGDLREGSPALRALREGAVPRAALEARGAVRVLDLSGGFGGVLERAGQNQRRNVKKARNRLAAEGSGRYALLRGGGADPALLAPFLDLERAGWKGRAGGAVLDQPVLRAFYEDFVQHLAAEGSLEWHRLEIGGRLAAAHLAVRTGRRLTLVRIAYDEAFDRLSPGALLFAEVAERACEEGGTDAVDCLTDMPWHERWGLARLASHVARVVSPGPLPWLVARLPEALRARARRIRGRGSWR
jgi:CelD/BcsL family acetyltransferase involved in cellulose biosynthesis